MATAAMPSSNWWHDINASPIWQDRIFDSLAVLYFLVALLSLVQLGRIHIRLPNCVWTPQKVFQSLILAVFAFRSAVFFYRRQVETLHSEILQHVLLDLPCLGFLTTYGVLCLFWADMYNKERNESSNKLKLGFIIINITTYLFQIMTWVILWRNPNRILVISSKMFFACVCLIFAVGYLVYGGRMFLLLKRLPVGVRGRERKLREVGYVTAICSTCFVVRSVMMGFCAFEEGADLDVLNHPVLNLVYYLVVEIMPCGLVLVLLRKLPRRPSLIPLYQPMLDNAEERNQG